MKTKTILKTLALAMMMPAMLLTTACSSSDDDSIINDETPAKKGYTIPVTINVTRQDDDATTRATYNGTSNKLEFSTGDKLFVSGLGTVPGTIAGTLTWQEGTTFKGTITTQYEYSGTADELFSGIISAQLLPAGYADYRFLTYTENNGYDATTTEDFTKAIVTSTTEKTAKALAVEQFSNEYSQSYSNGNGFALSPRNAILNFSITGLAPSTNVEVVLTVPGTIFGGSYIITKQVTSDASGNATFAVGVALYPKPKNLKDFTLTVGGKAITLTSSSKTLEAGHIYNITRTPGLLIGKFTINSSGKQVRFSQGNLQATTTDKGTNWTWGFATNQWDYIGRAAANTKINGNGTVSDNGTVDLFGWVGASNTTWTNAAKYGISNSQTLNSASTYGNVADEALKSDWGNTIGSGWRTLTTAEWKYLFNTRSGATVNGTSNARYARATINTDVKIVEGVILFPDGVTFVDSEAAWGTINGLGTRCTSAQWTALEAKGCVFLPAAGYRWGNEVYCAEGLGSYGNGFFYWSSSPYTSDVNYAQAVYFFNNNGALQMYYDNRSYGGSVRLVRDVVE